MTEYIEREKVLAEINGEERPNGVGVYDYYSRIFDIIDTAPAADVQEVKRGKWTHDEFDMLCCSECKEELEFEETTPYCPYCGAKMDGKDGEKNG